MVKKAKENGVATSTGDNIKLTLKQRKFCLAFVGEANGNGAEAARLAGYKGNDLTLRVIASENLTKPNIQRLIQQLRAKAEAEAAKHILSATEVLAGLTRFAKADVADLFPEDEWLQEAKKQGVSRLIKSIQRDKDTGHITKVEMYNAHGAHVDLGKYHKLFTDKIEIVNPTLAAKDTLQSIMSETGLPEDKARAIVSKTFGISEQELISESVN